MRKKSHISLAKFLLHNTMVEDLYEHKTAFYIGSILPDLRPSFLTKRHTIDETFDVLIKEIRRITIDYDVNKGINRYFARHLGVITHYLADYCTYPHNSIFTGSMTDHFHYEKRLKYLLNEYVEHEDAVNQTMKYSKFHTFEEIIQYIIKTHKDYLNAIQAIKKDIHYIVELCFRVVAAILQFFYMAFENLHRGISFPEVRVVKSMQ